MDQAQIDQEALDLEYFDSRWFTPPPPPPKEKKTMSSPPPPLPKGKETLVQPPPPKRTAEDSQPPPKRLEGLVPPPPKQQMAPPPLPKRKEEVPPPPLKVIVPPLPKAPPGQLTVRAMAEQQKPPQPKPAEPTTTTPKKAATVPKATPTKKSIFEFRQQSDAHFTSTEKQEEEEAIADSLWQEPASTMQNAPDSDDEQDVDDDPYARLTTKFDGAALTPTTAETDGRGKCILLPGAAHTYILRRGNRAILHGILSGSRIKEIKTHILYPTGKVSDPPAYERYCVDPKPKAFSLDEWNAPSSALADLERYMNIATMKLNSGKTVLVANQVGTWLHAFVEAIMHGHDPDPHPMFPGPCNEVKRYVKKRWPREMFVAPEDAVPPGRDPLLIEAMFGSYATRMCGTADGFVNRGGVLSVLDWKFSTGFANEIRACYEKALREVPLSETDGVQTWTVKASAITESPPLTFGYNIQLAAYAKLGRIDGIKRISTDGINVVFDLGLPPLDYDGTLHPLKIPALRVYEMEFDALAPFEKWYSDVYGNELCVKTTAREYVHRAFDIQRAALERENAKLQ